MRVTRTPDAAMNSERRLEPTQTPVASAKADIAALTHGRHCSCSACAREDWTKIVAPCGMHGPSCPSVYAPVAALGRASTRFDNDLRYRDGNHPAQWQFTPSYVLDLVREDLDGVIWLDPCTTEDNPTGADLFYTVHDDGLSKPWDSSVNRWSRLPVFVNPPYGKAREPWVDRCIAAGERGQPVILLIPAATDTRIFQKAARTAQAVVFVRGRVKFGTLRENRRQHAASHPSALIGWNTDLAACSALGWRVNV